MEEDAGKWRKFKEKGGKWDDLDFRWNCFLYPLSFLLLLPFLNHPFKCIFLSLPSFLRTFFLLSCCCRLSTGTTQRWLHLIWLRRWMAVRSGNGYCLLRLPRSLSDRLPSADLGCNMRLHNGRTTIPRQMPPSPPSLALQRERWLWWESVEESKSQSRWSKLRLWYQS